MKFWNRIKKSLSENIAKMAEANLQQFGNSGLDCCKLNKETPKK